MCQKIPLLNTGHISQNRVTQAIITDNGGSLIITLIIDGAACHYNYCEGLLELLRISEIVIVDLRKVAAVDVDYTTEPKKITNLKSKI